MRAAPEERMVLIEYMSEQKQIVWNRWMNDSARDREREKER